MNHVEQRYFFLRVLIKAPSLALIFLTLWLDSCTVLLDISDPLGNHEVILSSPEDPLATYRYRINSGIVSRSFPSASWPLSKPRTF